MTFWLKTPNNIYKNWLNSHFDRIMFTVSKLEIKKVKIVLEHPVYKNWMNFHIDRIIFTVSKLEIKKVKIQVEHPVQKLSFSNFQRF